MWSKPRRFISLAALLAGTALSVLPQVTSAKEIKPILPHLWSVCGLKEASIKPSAIVLFCDGTQQILDIKWISWDPKAATGNGTYVANNCIPYCGRGHFTQYAALVELKTVQAESHTLYFNTVEVYYLNPVTEEMASNVVGQFVPCPRARSQKLPKNCSTGPHYETSPP
jgi:hypothetical protein